MHPLSYVRYNQKDPSNSCGPLLYISKEEETSINKMEIIEHILCGLFAPCSHTKKSSKMYEKINKKYG
jgi:hypothetical protein